MISLSKTIKRTLTNPARSAQKASNEAEISVKSCFRSRAMTTFPTLHCSARYDQLDILCQILLLVLAQKPGCDQVPYAAAYGFYHDRRARRPG